MMATKTGDQRKTKTKKKKENDGISTSAKRLSQGTGGGESQNA